MPRSYKIRHRSPGEIEPLSTRTRRHGKRDVVGRQERQRNDSPVPVVKGPRGILQSNTSMSSIRTLFSYSSGMITFEQVRKDCSRALPLGAKRTIDILSDRHTLRLVNAFSFIVLVFSTVDTWKYSSSPHGSVEQTQVRRDQYSAIPHPLDLAVRSRVGDYGKAPDGKDAKHHAGYSGVRGGTFRSRYPSEYLEDTFDAIYVITNRKCPQQTSEFLSRAANRNLRVIQWPVIPYKEISLSRPPFPIHEDLRSSTTHSNKVASSLLKRQLGYFLAHRTIWQNTISRKHQRTLILDDTVFPNYRLMRILPSLFNHVDQESLAQQISWHVITFRRKHARYSSDTPPEPVWSSNPRYNHAVVRAHPSYGAGMYSVSLEGARWLLDHVKSYQAPMDIEFARLQEKHSSEFVVLSGCNNDEPRDFCPEIVDDISLPQVHRQFECVWRRLQERRLAVHADEILHEREAH